MPGIKSDVFYWLPHSRSCHKLSVVKDIFNVSSEKNNPSFENVSLKTYLTVIMISELKEGEQYEKVAYNRYPVGHLAGGQYS